MSVVSDVMKVGILAVDIDTLDEGSGVQSIDMYYRNISVGDGKLLFYSLKVLLIRSRYGDTWQRVHSKQLFTYDRVPILAYGQPR